MDKTVFPDVFQELDTKHFSKQMKQTSYKPFHCVDENSPFKNVFVDVSYVKNCIETLPNEELEKVIEHCNALIERNTVNMGGV